MSSKAKLRTLSANRQLLQLLTARLSRRIVLWIFASIILIEALILIPSVQRRQRELLNQVKEISSAKVAWIAATYPNATPEELLVYAEQMQQQPMMEVILGGAIYDTNGQRVGTFGAAPELVYTDVLRQRNLDFQAIAYSDPENEQYDVAWTIPSGNDTYLLMLRHDVSSVTSELYAFVLRIAGLVVIISVFVTVATVIILGPMVISPILQLRQDLLSAGVAVVNDRPPPPLYSASVQRRDELGEVIAAFKQMFQQINQAIRQRKQAEQQQAQTVEQLAQANAEIKQLNQRLRSENLRLNAELEVTRKLQQMLLPKEQELAQIDGLEIAGFMEPAAEVGGDYYDVISQDNGVKISIGDVTGHGLESGVLMIMAQTATRTLLANDETDPVKFLNALNQTIYDNVQRMNCHKSLTLSLLDYREGQVYLSGQHEEVIVVRADGSLERIDTIDLGFPLGLEADIASFVAQTHVKLAAGDGLVLYTDGITEAEDKQGEQYGLERLCAVVRRHWSGSAQAVQRAVIEDVQQHIGQQTVYDDITLLIIKQK
ncbi:MAG: PP2C family protein-serine/threonine phosphatase [Cyanophyceae cyanobacterium]